MPGSRFLCTCVPAIKGKQFWPVHQRQDMYIADRDTRHSHSSPNISFPGSRPKDTMIAAASQIFRELQIKKIRPSWHILRQHPNWERERPKATIIEHLSQSCPSAQLPHKIESLGQREVVYQTNFSHCSAWTSRMFSMHESRSHATHFPGNQLKNFEFHCVPKEWSRALCCPSGLPVTKFCDKVPQSYHPHTHHED